MKFTWNWLCDHLDSSASLAEILEALPMIGLEVEAVDSPAEKLKAFRVAEITSAERHPNADKLQVCQVNTGDETIQIVCGAPNARAGLKTVLAVPGTYIPGLDITIKKGDIRGETSHGMLCSAAELQINEEADGIMELPADADVGSPAAQAAGLTDTMIEIAITPNRGDCLGVRGVARDLAAAGFGTLKPLNLADEAGSYDSPVTWSIQTARATDCPLVTGRHFRGLTNGPSPEWMARRLTAIGQRPISVLVDITNYVMFDLGRPLHAYDADKIAGGELIIRNGQDGETITALNEKTYDIASDMIVIGDSEGGDDIAGVMGGERTAVSDETTAMFLEIAIFDPVSVATTGRQLNLHSDARYRFERGLDSEGPIAFAGHIARLICELTGAEASHLVVAGEPIPAAEPIAFSTDAVKNLTGVDVDAQTQQTILTKLGFTIDAQTADSWQVTRPSWRPDIHGKADIIEEIVRIYGYEHLPMESLPDVMQIAKPSVSKIQRRASYLRRALVARDYVEAVTFSFMKEEDAKLFGGGQHELLLANPISADLNAMRPSILPNLMSAVARNQRRGVTDISFFEVGPVFAGVPAEQQSVVCAGLRQGRKQIADWRQGNEAFTVFDGKADVMAALAAIGVSVDNLQVTNEAPDYYHPGRSGAIMQGRTVLAYFGEIHPEISQHFDCKGPVIGFELFFQSVPAGKDKGPAKPLIQLNALQPLSRDFAFVLDTEISANAVIKAITAGGKPFVSKVDVFDLYQGDKIEQGKKSLAFSVTLQPQKATLVDAEIVEICDKIIASVGAKCGGIIRD